MDNLTAMINGNKNRKELKLGPKTFQKVWIQIKHGNNKPKE